MSLLYLVLAVSSALTQVDKTMQKREAGLDVVVATIDQLKQLSIFPTTNLLLRRIAYVETRDGVDVETYRDGYYGGIWQVDEKIFNSTKDNTTFPALNSLLADVFTVIGLRWMDVDWTELERPFFSGLATIIYLNALPVSIPGPGNVREQGIFWKAYFNSDPADTVENFVSSVEELESTGRPLIFKNQLPLVYTYSI